MTSLRPAENEILGMNSELSPQGWGNLYPIKNRMNYLRSIPTGVGKPIDCYSKKRKRRVYPHGYGETCLKANLLSPRVRGNLHLTSAGVYPHGYGETIENPTCETCRWGLSPRVWGNHIDLTNSLAGLSPRVWGNRSNSSRSIPTGMGKPRMNTRRNAALLGSIPTGMGKPIHVGGDTIPTGMGKPMTC